MRQAADQQLIDKLARQATSRLALGQDASQRLSEFDHESFHPVSQFNDIEGMFDFVLISGVLEKQDPSESAKLIAHIRDQVARELVILIDNAIDTETEFHWPSTELIALGLRQIPEVSEKSSLRGFYFALKSYKRVPDWLNNRFWANPENFDKYRW